MHLLSPGAVVKFYWVTELLGGQVKTKIAFTLNTFPTLGVSYLQSQRQVGLELALSMFPDAADAVAYFENLCPRMLSFHTTEGSGRT